MNDVILGGIINLFALFGSKHKLDQDLSIERLSAYLVRFYGIRNKKSYVRLYQELRDLYDNDPAIDKDTIVEGICSNLVGRIRPEEKITVFLRIIEFCSISDGFHARDAIFEKVRELFGISDGDYSDMVSFIEGKACDNVIVKEIDGDCGIFKHLRIEGMLAVTYMGENSIFMDDIKMLSGVFQVWKPSSVVKSSHFRPIFYSTIMRMYDGDSKESMEFCGRNINFLYRKQGGSGKNGMHDLSFTLHSGELVAIMGGSGVGKSTLLSLLNGQMKPDSGTITINGHDISEPGIAKMIGFVPQDDLLFEELTVYENLWYTTRLCFDKMPDDALDRKVIAVLRELGLEAARDLKVGSPINKFISGGQRKRLNIALELIREPSVLFLDEPTSGLSSTDSEKVINILKELTGRGKLVITNIHQPSSDVFKLFDRLWLLDKGGYPVYDGNPIEAISYFKTEANYADPRTSACPVCGNVNPEIILNIIDDKMFDSTGSITDQRKTSPEEWHELYLEKMPQMPEPVISDAPLSDQKRPSRIKQTGIFLSRNIKAKITNLQYVLVTLLEAPVLAVICSLLTRYSKGDAYTLAGNINFPSFIFMAVIVAIFLGMSGSAEEIIKDRAILKREEFLSLSYSSYIWSKIIYMAIVCLVQSALFAIIGTMIIGLHGMLGIWLVVLFASAFLSALIGLLLSKVMNSVVAIYITIPLLLLPQILLCGLVVKFDDLAPDSNTGNVPIIGEVIPSRWAYEALAVSTYSMNGYERMVFEKDCERYQAFYYGKAFIPALQEANERIEYYGMEESKADINLVKNEIPYIRALCNLEPYHGNWNYESVEQALQEAQDVMKKRSNSASLEVDKIFNGYIKSHSKSELLSLKNGSYNSQLENLAANRNTEKMIVVRGDRILPRAGYIFLTPRSSNGRSHFYAGVKVLGERRIPTLYFNLGILFLMCLLIGSALFVKKDYICRINR